MSWSVISLHTSFLVQLAKGLILTNPNFLSQATIGYAGPIAALVAANAAHPGTNRRSTAATRSPCDRSSTGRGSIKERTAVQVLVLFDGRGRLAHLDFDPISLGRSGRAVEASQ